MAERRGRRRVVVTGLGACSALGADAESLWRACLDGRTRVEAVPAGWPQREQLRSRVWSPLGEAARPACALLGRAEPRRLDASGQMALAAAEQALGQAGLALTIADEKRRTFRLRDVEATRFGVFVGTGAAGIVSMLAYGGHVGITPARTRLQALAGRLATGGHAEAAEAQAIFEALVTPAVFNPFAVAMSMANSVTANLSIKLGARGPTPTFAGACAAGTLAIGHAARAIADGDCDTALAGGSEHLGDAWGAIFRAFDAVGALAHGELPPERINRPFDRARSGFLFAEGGAAMLVLEEMESARRRGAPLLAEVRGMGEASDAHDIMAPDPAGAGVRAAIEACLADAGLDAGDVAHVNAHGTGTPGNDGVEAAAIAAVIGTHAVVTSTKSLLGHSLGASGALEAVVTVLALRDQVVHPTRNLEEPVADLRFATAPTQLAMRHAISQSFAFGGHDAVIALSRVE